MSAWLNLEFSSPETRRRRFYIRNLKFFGKWRQGLCQAGRIGSGFANAVHNKDRGWNLRHHEIKAKLFLDCIGKRHDISARRSGERTRHGVLEVEVPRTLQPG